MSGPKGPLVLVAFAAAVAIGLLLSVPGHPPLLLVVAFAIWVLVPFAGLAWALAASKRWPASTRTALHVVAVVVVLGSLAVYTHTVLRPPRTTPARMWVLVPVVSSLLLAAAVALAGWISRRRAGRVTVSR